MKKPLFLLVSILTIGLLGFSTTASAQGGGRLNTMLPPLNYSANNGSGLVTFNFYNSNPYDIYIDSIYTVDGVSGINSFYIWYNTTPVNGLPTSPIPSTASWIAADTQTYTSLGSTTTVIPVMGNVGLVIPANTVYGIALGGFTGQGTPSSGSMRYYSVPASTTSDTTTIGGCSLILGTNVSYGSTSYTATPTFYPKGFVGTITFKIASLPNDASVVGLESPAHSANFCSGEYPVKIKIKNKGSNAIDEVKVDWTIDGTPQTTLNLNFNPGLAPQADTIITLSNSVDFPFQTPVEIEAWTSQPNGVVDANPSDDSMAWTLNSQKQGVLTQISPQQPNICEGASITLDAGTQPNGSTFIWSTGAGTQSIVVSQFGSYYVRVISPNGCEDADTVNVTVSPRPRVGDFGAEDHGNGNFVFTPARMANINYFHWDFGDGSTRTVTSDAPQVHHYDRPGTYPVTLTLQGGCDDEQITKQIFVSQQGLGIHQLDQQGTLSIYPNPTRDFVSLDIRKSKAQLQKLVIYDLRGAKVLDQELNGQQQRVSLKSLSSGLYHLHIITSEGSVNSKIQLK